MENIVILLALICIVVIMILWNCRLTCSFSETFGQDASIRASAGWIAGPKGMYGYDPIDQFAEQIAEMKERKRRAYLELMNSDGSLVDSPTKSIGPDY